MQSGKIIAQTKCFDYIKLTANFSTSTINSAFKKSFKTSMVASNPIIDGPDYTFLDGRPTPLRPKQRTRAIQQKDAVTRAFKLMGEIDFALKRHQNKLESEEQNQQEILKSKFKRKNAKIQD